MKSINKFKKVFQAVAIALLAQCAACAPSTEERAEEGLATQEQAGLTFNGLTFNGLTFNGLTFNGLTFNGVAFNGVEVVGGQLVGTRSDTGEPLRGEDFEGATLQAVLSDGSTLPLTIEAVDPTSDPELLNYTVRYWDGSSWKSLCGESNGAPIQAMALRGHWDLSSGTATGGDFIDDSDMFTFACHGAALAKCVMLGYKPWQTVTECDGTTCHEVPMRALHQACTRMIRADYCGDGTPHTRNGVPINVWDAFNVQRREETQGAWLRDAEWSSEGAVCIEHLRYMPDETTAYINAHCPERWVSASACFGSDSTFFTENGQSTPISQRSLIRNEFDALSTAP